MTNIDMENISKEALTDLFSKIDSCIDVEMDYSGKHIGGIDFLLNDGKFLSLGINYRMYYGDCEHYLYFCIDDEDPREWKKAMTLKYGESCDEVD